MDKNHLIQLTNELYRLTLLFPKKEPLRYKMREVADDILTKCLRCDIESNPAKTVENSSRPLVELEVIDSFFEVAKNQNWVSPVEILRIQEEYDRVRAEIKKFFKRPPEITVEEKITPTMVENCSRPIKPVLLQERLSEREEKILNFLKQNGQAQVWQLKQIFPEVTKRTLRRDFSHLLKQGKIERFGQRNETFYQLKI